MAPSKSSLLERGGRPDRREGARAALVSCLPAWRPLAEHSGKSSQPSYEVLDEETETRGSKNLSQNHKANTIPCLVPELDFLAGEVFFWRMNKMELVTVKNTKALRNIAYGFPWVCMHTHVHVCAV